MTTGTLQFACFLARESLLEFNTSDDPISRMLVADPLQLEDGYVHLPNRPGLGADLDRYVPVMCVVARPQDRVQRARL